MADYSTTVHTPADQAPPTTGLVASCAVCKTQWQVKSENREDAKVCPFCGAGNDYGAITVYSEAPDYGGAKIYGGS